MSDYPWRLLSAVDGIDLCELPGAAECCGFGGTFSVKNVETSAAMAANKIVNICATEAGFITAGDASCLLNTGDALRRQDFGVHAIYMVGTLVSTKETPFDARNHQEASLRGE